MSEFFRLLPARIVREITHSPIGILLGVISALSVFAKSPNVIGSSNEAPQMNLLSTVEPERIISWFLVALAINFVLSRVGALVVRNRFWSGLLYSVVFGAIAILASTYMAVEYLAPEFGRTDPQLSLSGFSDRAKVWHGLHVEGITTLCVLMWFINAASAYGSAISDYFRVHPTEESSKAWDGGGDAVVYFSMMFVLLSLGGLAVLSALILGGVSQSFVDAVLWQTV